jgi:hypothetical protein
MEESEVELLRETKLLDYRHESIQALVAQRSWRSLDRKSAILAIYNFVRDEIRFGYNLQDELPASRILSDGIGQCNSKGILFMALLRACGIECRFHGFCIDKQLQKGAITGIWYRLAPPEIVHSWVELEHEGRWVNLEGFILDMAYLHNIQAQNPESKESFCGYGVATTCLAKPEVEWEGGDTYIQKEGIVRDFGVYNDPDGFFQEHKQALGPLKKMVFQHITRHVMNRNVARIREAYPR